MTLKQLLYCYAEFNSIIDTDKYNNNPMSSSEYYLELNILILISNSKNIISKLNTTENC